MRESGKGQKLNLNTYQNITFWGAVTKGVTRVIKNQLKQCKKNMSKNSTKKCRKSIKKCQQLRKGSTSINKKCFKKNH